MPQLIKAKIDLAKIHGAKVLKKDGRIFVEVTASQLFEGKNGALYLDAALFPTPQSQYGDDWHITQDLPKALRDAGQRGPILGNAKNKDFGGGNNSAPKPETETRTTMFAPAALEDVPF
jgi:hypothetical protein